MIMLVISVNNKNMQSFYIKQNNGTAMSQSQTQNESTAKQNNATNSLDPNWRDDALDLGLDYGMQTIAVRAGQHRTDEGEHSEPIFTTSSYVYQSAADAAAHFDGTKTGNVYSRHTKPSVLTFERRLAALEIRRDILINFGQSFDVKR